jgi:hypothetical protein
MQLMLHAGLRAAEVLALTVYDVDWRLSLHISRAQECAPWQVSIPMRQGASCATEG